MRKDFWAIVWLFVSVGIFIAANLYTKSPVLDVTLAHIVIAGILGFLVTAICFVLWESVLFIARVAKTVAAKGRH